MQLEEIVLANNRVNALRRIFCEGNHENHSANAQTMNAINFWER